ncbi:MAG: hypothetical protein FJ379_10785 [Verrucomicrobia bacterium]|nr:hypothetical protein [Verrucomicrobiota bacterium]
MAFRLDSITADIRGPLRGTVLKGLAGLDLIVLLGPNGSGKSTLLEPLKNGSRGVGCLDPATGRAESFSATGVNQKVAFLTSVQLMEKFRDLNDALDLAANSIRPSDEALVLGKLKGQLDKDTPEASDPPGLEHLRGDYLQQDRICGPNPRTVDEYERLGRRLADRKGVVWRSIDLDAEAGDRKAAELQLLPESRKLAGLNELRPGLNDLHQLPQNPAMVPAGALVDAETQLRSELEAARNAVEGLPPPGAGVTLGDEAKAVLQHLNDALEAIQAVLDAKDLLKEVRTKAKRFLEKREVSPAQPAECPVCEVQINASQIILRLGEQTSGTDVEADELGGRKKKFKNVRDRLHPVLERWAAAVGPGRDAFVVLTGSVESIGLKLAPTVGSDESVRIAAEDLRNRCGQWNEEYFGGPTRQALEGIRDLGHCAETYSKMREQIEADLNQDLAAAQNDFKNFQKIGDALAAARALDRLEWSANPDEAEAERLRTEQRQTWLEVLQQMITERQCRASSARDEVVNDLGVQERFNRFIEKVGPIHPSLRQMAFRGKRLDVGGQDTPEDLSEGQRVLVNIAAAMAVVGKVAGTPDHKPGWIAFDEPTNGLDDDGRGGVADYLGGMSLADVPSQIIVATFDRLFADGLIQKALTSGRAVGRVELPQFEPGRCLDLAVQRP